jgi:hypothetical protein
MIIHLNGWPGAGKLTVGRELAGMLGARLLDNHTLHNVAAALCDRGTAAYWELYGKVRTLAYDRLRELPMTETAVMTNALTREAPHEVEAWQEVLRLVADRGDILIAVTLLCEPEENLWRVQQAERRLFRKLTDPRPLAEWLQSGSWSLEFGEGSDHQLTIDNTTLSAAATAERILVHLREIGVL